MMPTSPAYIPGILSTKNRPLERYLPPIPPGIAKSWITSRSLQGKFVLDPFGAAPDLSAEAAYNGARMIVAANNPIARLLIEISAHPPNQTEAHTVLAMLAASRVREQRLEPHIRALYETDCPHCGAVIQAKAFLWEKGASNPYARLIDCAKCQTAGEFPTTEADRQSATRFTTKGLHHARALERVAPLNDPDRIHVEEALNVYPLRAVYALLTLINKLDALDLQPEQENILAILLLSAFDQANTLWPHPIARERPRQLTIPPIYRENNIWMALESASDYWIDSDASVPITHWPELPSEQGGICLFEGRIKALAEQLTNIQLAAVLTAIPRPNQAFWTLSALWAGWLWGHAAVEDFKSVLRRRRYDWTWHTAALQASLESLLPTLRKNLAALGLVGEAEPGYIAASIIAAAQAGFQLDGIALSTGTKQAQIYWQVSEISSIPDVSDTELPEVIRSAAHEYLLARGEPCSYLQLHTAILSEIGTQFRFPNIDSPADNYNQFQQVLQANLNYRNGFLRFSGSEKSLEVGKWWLSDTNEIQSPLADRVEIAVVQYLIKNPHCTLENVEAAIYQKFPGLLTPTSALIYECLQSYGEESESGWQLRDQDIPTKRKQELNMMATLLDGLGQKLGFETQIHETVTVECIWNNAKGNLTYRFYLSASALLGKFLIEEDPTPARGVIVLPGGRANLVMFKLHNDPRLAQSLEQGWQFIKYRQVRQLADNPSLNLENLESQLGLDPLTYSETQLRMF